MHLHKYFGTKMLPTKMQVRQFTGICLKCTVTVKEEKEFTQD